MKIMIIYKLFLCYLMICDLRVRLIAQSLKTNVSVCRASKNSRPSIIAKDPFILIKRLNDYLVLQSLCYCPSSNHLQTTLIRFEINRTDLCHLTLSLPLVFKFMLHNKFRICKPTNIKALLLLLIIKLPLMHIC